MRPWKERREGGEKKGKDEGEEETMSVGALSSCVAIILGLSTERLPWGQLTCVETELVFQGKSFGLAVPQFPHLLESIIVSTWGCCRGSD